MMEDQIYCMTWVHKFSFDDEQSPTNALIPEHYEDVGHELEPRDAVKWLYYDGQLLIEAEGSHLDIIRKLAEKHGPEIAYNALMNSWRGRYDSKNREMSMTIENAHRQGISAQPPPNLVQLLQHVFPEVERIWSFPGSRPILGAFDDQQLDQIYKHSKWAHNFVTAQPYFFEDTRSGDLEQHLLELFKVEYAIGELHRRQRLNQRLQFRKRHQVWMDKLKNHALQLATQEVGPKILQHTNQWLAFHSGSGFAEVISGIESGESWIQDDGKVVLGGGFEYEIGDEVIEMFLRSNPAFTMQVFNENFEDQEYLQEYIEQQGENPLEWDDERKFENVKESIESFGYSFSELRKWLSDWGDFEGTLQDVVKIHLYPAWRQYWAGQIEAAEENVQASADRLEQALESPELGNLFAAINLALNAQHVHGSMYEHMDISGALMDELSSLDTDSIDEWVDVITGPDWKAAKTAQYEPATVPKFYSDDIDMTISDVDRYTSDKYWISIQILESVQRWSVGLNMINSHVGICGQGQYWQFDKNEGKQAKATFAEVKNISMKLKDEIEYTRPPMAIITPLFRSALRYVDFPHRERSGVYNYNWYEELEHEADWRTSLYGQRYPYPSTATQQMRDGWINRGEQSKDISVSGRSSRQRTIQYKQASWSHLYVVAEDRDWMKSQPSPYGLDYKPPKSDATLWLATFIGRHWRWTIPTAVGFLAWFANSGGDQQNLVTQVQQGATPDQIMREVAPQNISDSENAPTDENVQENPEIAEFPDNSTELVDTAPESDSITLPRGIRNNNPGNIRRTDVQWEGLAEDQPDGEFFAFESPEYGVRAMARVLRSYQRRHQLETIEQIVNRWAPPSENDTASYVQHVSQRLGIPPDSPLDLEDDHLLARLIQVMLRHENGGNFIDDETIQNGISLEKSGGSSRTFHYAYQIDNKFEAKARMFQIMRDYHTTDWDIIVRALIDSGINKRLLGWLNQQWLRSVSLVGQNSWEYKYAVLN